MPANKERKRERQETNAPSTYLSLGQCLLGAVFPLGWEGFFDLNIETRTRPPSKALAFSLSFYLHNINVTMLRHALIEVANLENSGLDE